jgi:TRAP-type mannitol/chloroaromatic compound transport system permease small subunit
VQATPPATPGAAPRGAWERLIERLSVCGTALILVVMLAMDADILGRALFNHPVAGVAEVVTMSLAAIVFLQLPAALAAGRIVQSDTLLASLQQTAPRLCAALRALWCGAGAAVFGLLSWAGLPLFLKDWTRGEVYGVPGLFTFPRWPVGAVILLGCAVTAALYLRLAVQALREARRAPLPA